MIIPSALVPGVVSGAVTAIYVAAKANTFTRLEALYREEAPSGRAPKCYDAMRECIEGRVRLDPASDGDAHEREA